MLINQRSSTLVLNPFKRKKSRNPLSVEASAEVNVCSIMAAAGAAGGSQVEATAQQQFFKMKTVLMTKNSAAQTAHEYLLESAGKIQAAENLDELSGYTDLKPLLHDHAMTALIVMGGGRAPLPGIYEHLVDLSRSPYYQKIPSRYSELLAHFLHPNFTKKIGCSQPAVLQEVYATLLRAFVQRFKLINLDQVKPDPKLYPFKEFAGRVLSSLELQMDEYFQLIHQQEASKLSEPTCAAPASPTLGWGTFLNRSADHQHTLGDYRDLLGLPKKCNELEDELGHASQGFTPGYGVAAAPAKATGVAVRAETFLELSLALGS